jgi:hypothetical protein
MVPVVLRTGNLLVYGVVTPASLLGRRKQRFIVLERDLINKANDTLQYSKDKKWSHGYCLDKLMILLLAATASTQCPFNLCTNANGALSLTVCVVLVSLLP